MSDLRGKTRFRFDDKEGRGTWICNHCGAGDGADLAMKVTGMSSAIWPSGWTRSSPTRRLHR